MKVLRSEKGYTLIEMVGVVFIMLVVFASSVSYLGNRSRLLDRQAAQVAASLRLARSKAILNGHSTGVQFQVGEAQRVYLIFEDVGVDGKGPGDLNYGDIGPDTGEANTKWDQGVPPAASEPASEQKNTLYEGILFGVVDPTLPQPDQALGGDDPPEVGSDPIPAPLNAIVFDVRGHMLTPKDESGTPIEDPNNKFVYLLNAQRTEMRAIRVDPYSGYIQIYKWNITDQKWSYQ